MIDGLYDERILALAADIPRIGRLPTPDGTATAHAWLCGSSLTVDVRLAPDGTVAEFAHEVRACLLGQAAASLMARHAVGLSARDIGELRAAVRAMLREDGPAPSGRFAEFAILEPIRGFRARHASTLLTFDALADAVADASRRRAAA